MSNAVADLARREQCDARTARNIGVSTHARAARAEQPLSRSCILMATILNNVSLLRAARGLGVAATRDLCCASGVFGSRLRRVAPRQSHSHPLLLAQSMGLCVRESASSDPQQWQLGLELHCSGYARGLESAGARLARAAWH